MKFKNYLTGDIVEDSNHAIFGDFDDTPQNMYAKPAVTPLSEPPNLYRKNTENDPTVIMKQDAKGDMMLKLNNIEKRLSTLERMLNGRRAG